MAVKKKYTLERPLKKTLKRKTANPIKINWLIWSGVSLVILGLLGSVISYLDVGHRPLAEYLPSETAYYVKINPTKLPNSQAEWLLSLTQTDTFFQDASINDFLPWIGREAMLATTTDNKFIIRFRYHNRSAAKKFLTQSLLVPGETWQLSKWADPNNRWFLSVNGQEIFSIPRQSYKIFSPKFSNTVSYSFTDGYLWLASDQSLLEKTLSKKESNLQTKPAYQASEKHLNKKNSLEIFIHPRAVTTLNDLTSAQTTLSPLFDGIIDVIPGIVITAHPKLKRFQWQLRFISNKKNSLVDIKPLNTPELANFSPDNPVLLFTGQDLLKHYQQTNQFLSTMHPQFSDIFDGIWQAQAEKTFGPNFDFYTDFLSQLSGQYSLIIESNLPDQTPNFTLISEFGRSDTAAKVAQLQEALRFAQGKSTARVITVDLPGGKEQDQAVNISTSELIVKEYPMKHGSVYEVANTNLGTTVYFGFREQYLILSITPTTINKIFSGEYKPLTENTNFRDTVLFEHDQAESYGYISMTEAQKSLEYVFVTKELSELDPNNETDVSTEADKKITWLDQISTQFDAAVFSQKRDGNDVWWEIDLVE